MKMNLKKARKLEMKINSEIDNGRVDMTSRVRVSAKIDTIEQKIAESNKTALATIDNKKALINLRYRIRRMIAKENEIFGINALIAEKTELLAQKDLLNIYMREDVSYDKEELEDVIAQANKELNKDGTFMRSKSALLDVSIMSQDDMDNMKDQYIQVVRDIEDIDDKIAEKNYITKIELVKKDIDLLKLNKLV